MAKVKVFRCEHSGLYFPGDYSEKWGSIYGRGLGPVPVSECLNTQANDFDPSKVALVAHQVPAHLWMLPVGETYADVEMLYVSEEELGSEQEQLVEEPVLRALAPHEETGRILYEQVDMRKVRIGPDHPKFVRGNRMICRYDDPTWSRIRAAVRAKQEKSPHWAKLQALVGGLTYGAPERTVWA